MAAARPAVVGRDVARRGVGEAAGGAAVVDRRQPVGEAVIAVGLGHRARGGANGGSWAAGAVVHRVVGVVDVAIGAVGFRQAVQQVVAEVLGARHVEPVGDLRRVAGGVVSVGQVLHLGDAVRGFTRVTYFRWSFVPAAN